MSSSWRLSPPCSAPRVTPLQAKHLQSFTRASRDPRVASSCWLVTVPLTSGKGCALSPGTYSRSLLTTGSWAALLSYLLFYVRLQNAERLGQMIHSVFSESASERFRDTKNFLKKYSNSLKGIWNRTPDPLKAIISPSVLWWGIQKNKQANIRDECHGLKSRSSLTPDDYYSGVGWCGLASDMQLFP